MSGIALDWQFELEVDWQGKQLDLHLEKTTETGISTDSAEHSESIV